MPSFVQLNAYFLAEPGQMHTDHVLSIMHTCPMELQHQLNHSLQLAILNRGVLVQVFIIAQQLRELDLFHYLVWGSQNAFQ